MAQMIIESDSGITATNLNEDYVLVKKSVLDDLKRKANGYDELYDEAIHNLFRSRVEEKVFGLKPINESL